MIESAARALCECRGFVSLFRGQVARFRRFVTRPSFRLRRGVGRHDHAGRCARSRIGRSQRAGGSGRADDASLIVRCRFGLVVVFRDVADRTGVDVGLTADDDCRAVGWNRTCDTRAACRGATAAATHCRGGDLVNLTHVAKVACRHGKLKHGRSCRRKRRTGAAVDLPYFSVPITSRSVIPDPTRHRVATASDAGDG